MAAGGGSWRSSGDHHGGERQTSSEHATELRQGPVVVGGGPVGWGGGWNLSINLGLNMHFIPVIRGRLKFHPWAY